VCKKAVAAAESKEIKRRKLPSGVYLGVGPEPAARNTFNVYNTEKAFGDLAEVSQYLCISTTITLFYQLPENSSLHVA